MVLHTLKQHLVDGHGTICALQQQVQSLLTAEAHRAHLVSQGKEREEALSGRVKWLQEKQVEMIHKYRRYGAHLAAAVQITF